jgi:hypothetical protein
VEKTYDPAVQVTARSIMLMLELEREIECEKAQEPARSKGRKTTNRKVSGQVTPMTGWTPKDSSPH